MKSPHRFASCSKMPKVAYSQKWGKEIRRHNMVKAYTFTKVNVAETVSLLPLERNSFLN